MSDPLLIFLHIGKAAGQTLEAIMRRQYAPHEIAAYSGRFGVTPHFSEEELGRARVVMGHIPFGIHRAIPRPSNYTTLLREPVPRVISLYRYIVSTPAHHLHTAVRELDLLSFVTSEIDAMEVDNGQTRQLAGDMEAVPDRSSLRAAQTNLRESFATVGVVERFDETVFLMSRRFGWAWPFYRRRNVTSHSMPNSPSTPDAVAAIRDRNRLDAELYAVACALLDEEVKRQPLLVRAEIPTFRAVNGMAQFYRSMTRRDSG